MKPARLVVGLLVGLVLLATACSPQAASTATQAPVATQPAAVVPVTGNASIKVVKNDQLGSFLVDDKGMTLYLFTKDTPNTSNCYDKCATAWPPLLTADKTTSGDGVDASKLGTTQRKDGATQVTYNGWPLYYYVKDKAAGDVTGQDVGGVWFVISPAGDKVESAAAATEAPAASGSAAMVDLGKNDQLGSFLVDGKGMALYLFTKDTPNTSVCYDKCATAWPPLLTSGEPVAGAGVDASKFGTTTRKDGTMQVTYNGWPLYYYEKDKAPGDVTGQDVGGVWYVVNAAGDKVESAAAATEAPASSASSGTTVSLGQNDTLGSFLVDDKGMSLYLFTKDTPNTSVCYDKCATAWPPLLTTGAPVAGDGVDESKLGTTTRKDGSVQVTYNGWPLYYYEKDTAAGDVTGQDVGGVWYVVNAAGDQVTSP